MEKQTERTLPSSMELLEFFHAVEGERVQPDEPRLDPGAYIKLNCTCACNASFVVVDEILEAENAGLKKQLTDLRAEIEEDRRSAAQEALWQEWQGEDYGSY